MLLQVDSPSASPVRGLALLGVSPSEFFSLFFFCDYVGQTWLRVWLFWFACTWKKRATRMILAFDHFVLFVILLRIQPWHEYFIVWLVWRLAWRAKTHNISFYGILDMWLFRIFRDWFNHDYFNIYIYIYLCLVGHSKRPKYIIVWRLYDVCFCTLKSIYIYT